MSLKQYELCSSLQNAGHSIVCGDVDAAWKDCAHVIEGRVRVGGQEHFYLEPQGTVILPGENDEFIVISSTQVGQFQIITMQGQSACSRASQWGWLTEEETVS